MGDVVFERGCGGGVHAWPACDRPKCTESCGDDGIDGDWSESAFIASICQSKWEPRSRVSDFSEVL